MDRPVSFRLPPRKSRPALRHLASDRGGAVQMIFALTLVPVLLGAGLAVDTSRAYFAQEALKAAGDAGALAGVRAISSVTQAKADAKMYFRSNLSSSSIDADDVEVDVVVDQLAGSVTVTARTDLDTAFMRLADIDTVAIESRSVAKAALNPPLELVLVLDNSYSMNSSGRMTALKDATDELLKAVFMGASSRTDVAITVIPFSTAVNVDREDFLRGGSAPPGWDGCYMRRGGGGVLDPDDTDDTDDDPDGDGLNGDDTQFDATLPGTEPFDALPDYLTIEYWTSNGKSKNNKKNKKQSFTYTAGCPRAEMLVHEGTLADIQDTVDDMRPEGNTNIPGAMAWARRALDPTWRDLWNSGVHPADWDSDDWQKVVILLSDGENFGTMQVDFDYEGTGSDVYPGSSLMNPITDAMDERLSEVCEGLTDKGVEVYAIGMNPNDGLEAVLSDCASKDENYFETWNSTELVDTFERIGTGFVGAYIAE